MRKIHIAWGLMLAATTLAGCQKDSEPNDAQSTAITRSFSVSDKEWTDPQVRSVYEPGVGVYLTGDESVSIFYGDTNASASNVYMGPVAGTSDQAGNYSFTHDAVSGAAAYNYYFVMPHLNSHNTNSSKTGLQLLLSRVQMPADNSFDPMADILFGKAQTNVSPATSLQVVDFKRLFTPLQIKITDGAGVLTGKKIYSVNVAFLGSGITNEDINLTGQFYASPSDAFADSKPNSWAAGSTSAAVTAEYKTGLPALNGYYPVWFMVNPTTIPSGSTLMITVAADDQLLTREIITDHDLAIVKDKINTLTFNISGGGYTVRKSFTQCFAGLSKLGAAPKLTASNGVEYTWATMNCDLSATKIDVPALRMKANTTPSSSITLPTGKKITGLRIVENQSNLATKAAADNKLILSADGTDIGTYDFNYFTENAMSGGVCEIFIAQEHEQKTLTLKKVGSSATYINSITVIYEN